MDRSGPDKIQVWTCMAESANSQWHHRALAEEEDLDTIVCITDKRARYREKDPGHVPLVPGASNAADKWSFTKVYPKHWVTHFNV